SSNMASVMEDKSHPSLLLLQLNDQRLQGLFCDITLVVEDTKFKAHRNVLAAVSPYFKELISSQTARATDQVLELPDVKAEVFADVLTFIYSSRVFIESSALAKELASTGKKLGIKCLENLEKSTSKQMDAAPCGQPSTVILLSAVQEPPKAKENSGALNPGSEESSRPLACRYCNKTFILNKRLQTHEALCRQSDRIPVEEENSVNTGDQEINGTARQPREDHPAPPRKPKGHSHLLFRQKQDHFVKVVDGHIIYFCTVCERSYMTLSSLKRHSNVHSWRRKYPCRYCNKVFALAEYRTKHEVWHTGERRYQCIFCWETFVTYYNLKTHQKAFHGINPRLITSEKTPNGGYKPKLNALKLYRLLPMRSQKRPYKTYSHSLSESVLIPPTDIPLSLTTENSPVDPCGASGSSVDGVVSTVIAYGHPTPSVIVHNTSVSSVITHSNTQNPSVIAYNNKDKNQTSPSTPGPIKKQVLKEYARSQQKASCSTEDQRSKEKRDKGRSSNSKTMTYMAKPACVGATSESRSVPLCQITVRIGEEAIVKRRISETDLRRDTSPSSKSKSHMQSKAEEDEKRADLSFGNDACDDESDRDAEDMLWRPYYSYKPKRKMCGVQKLKKSRWRRKLRYKRSLRWVKEDAEEKASFKAADSRSMDCETCGKTFSDLSSLKKHEKSHAPEVARHRAGRKPSVRHTCVFCFKVCKTAAALGRHMKLHDTEEHAPDNATKTKMSVFNKTETRTSSASEDENAREMEVTYSSGGGTTPEEAKAEKCPTSSKNTVLHSCSSHEPVIRNSSMPSCPDTQTNPSQVTSAPNGNSGENSSAQETVLSYTSATASKGQPADQLEEMNVTFYPDPYPLMYGQQLLAYPYNFGNIAALPVALNMVIPDEKGQPLPFLPSVFGYVNPCRNDLQVPPVGLSGNPGRGPGNHTTQERLKKGNL
uniref:Zinc finger and BTB domain containing 4 n=1 Tax=Latimeria chalumnae TaxID=7897 RepID=H3AXR4_LATCH